MEAANIPHSRFHDCRHTFASRLAMAGVDLYTVQRAGGWKTQVMVQRYAHLSHDHIKAAVERLVRGNSGAATGTKTGTDLQGIEGDAGQNLLKRCGEPSGTRTRDSLLKRQVLYLLS